MYISTTKAKSHVHASLYLVWFQINFHMIWRYNPNTTRLINTFRIKINLFDEFKCIPIYPIRIRIWNSRIEHDMTRMLPMLKTMEGAAQENSNSCTDAWAKKGTNLSCWSPLAIWQAFKSKHHIWCCMRFCKRVSFFSLVFRYRYLKIFTKHLNFSPLFSWPTCRPHAFVVVLGKLLSSPLSGWYIDRIEWFVWFV